MRIYTVGHSTHDAETFRRLIASHEIEVIADVRTVPRSRRVPHFDAESLPGVIEPVAYVHLPALGGLRKPTGEVANAGWEHSGFRGYADHMSTEAFRNGLISLLDLAARKRAAVMCAEGLWRQCHRRLLSDALTVRGWRVAHILPPGTLEEHRLTEFAVVEGDRLSYPAAQGAFDI